VRFGIQHHDAPAERTVNVAHEGLDTAYMEPRLMALAASNLLANALRYARRQVRVHGAAGPEWATLAIEDDGPGIAPEHAAAVLARGVRLDESGAGAGLGVAIARELVEAMGGGIDLGVSPLGGLAVRLSGRARHAP
jgi:signal transduction histidine kinase